MSVQFSMRGAIRAAVLMVAVMAPVSTGHAGTPQNDLPLKAIAFTATDPFGISAAPVSDGGLLRKWQGVVRAIDAEMDTLSRCRNDRSNCNSPAALRLIAIIDSARNRDGLAKLGEVNRAINLAIRPISDEVQYGVQDHWSSPISTLTSGAGDCEDYAIAKYVALREAGIAPSDMRLLIVDDRLFGEEHAVLAVRFDGGWRILDNRRFIMIEDTQMRQSQPLFAIDQTGVRRFADPTIALADALNLPANRDAGMDAEIAVAMALLADEGFRRGIF